MRETPDELRARLNALAVGATPLPWGVTKSYVWCSTDVAGLGGGFSVEMRRETDAEMVVALVNAWPEIDNLLARLATAEKDAADTIDALLARLATAEAENERHRGANLVRAVMHGADPEWIADLVSAESFDAIPWQIAYRIRSEAVARREQP